LNCKKNTIQNAPKLTILRAKIKKNYGKGPGDTPPVSTPHPLGAFGASILAPAALDLPSCAVVN